MACIQILQTVQESRELSLGALFAVFGVVVATFVRTTHRVESGRDRDAPQGVPVDLIGSITRR